MAFNWFKKKKQQTQAPNDESSVERKDQRQVEEDLVEPAEETGSEAIQAAESSETAADTPDDTDLQVEAETQAADLEDDENHDSEEEPAQTDEKTSGNGFFGRLKQGLSKTRYILTADIEDIFAGKEEVDGNTGDDVPVAHEALQIHRCVNGLKRGHVLSRTAADQ